jgi:DNA-binding GntR family transcriptional regulator
MVPSRGLDPRGSAASPGAPVRLAPVHPDDASSVSEPRPLNHATLSEQVYQHLRGQILANAYPPHAALPEKTLATQLNVSRVPVREALHRLAADGLVTLRPRQGAFVSSLSPRQFLDAYRVREALEELAIKLALPNLTPTDLDELSRLQQAMRRHARPTTPTPSSPPTAPSTPSLSNAPGTTT